MNTLRNTLYVSLTLQICLAAAILAAAEEAPLALVTLPLALGSLLVIDLMAWVRPPRLLLNLVALGALGLSLVEFREAGEARLLAGGHLVVYLTWTFLLQQKDLRRMWWMFALSVLQVALGAVLTTQPWFGAALFVYTASTVWTMSLLSLTRAALLADPQLLSREPEEPEAEEPLNTPLIRRSWALNGVRTDEQGRWISPRFLGGGALTFVLILVVGLSFFVLTPRVWIGPLNVFGDSPLRGRGGATGFTENVKLGDIGEVMESQELVMEVAVLHGETELPMDPGDLAAAVGDEPLFRGAVLETYASGSWKRWRYHSDQWTDSNDKPGPVRLMITLQPLESAVLFYTGDGLGATGFTEPTKLYYQPYSQALERSDDANMGLPYSYTVSTNPIEGSTEPLVHDVWKQFNRLNRNLEARLLQTPTTRLTQLAKQVLNRSPQAREPGSEAAARVLEAYLLDSNEFSYTLNLSVDDPTIDPVEDFVFNRKKGHCEYFASALALMLRGVGIPSRVISGFKGAEYNGTTGQLEVRALHAHAWVEGFVEGDWVTFDPTPGQRDSEVASKVKDAAPDLVDQSRSFWFQGMSYSKSQQDQLVYAPLRDIGQVIQSNFAGLMSGEFPLLTPIKALLSSPSQWFSGAGGTVALCLLLSLAGTVWLVRNVFRRWKGWKGERELAQRRAITVEFYARLLQLLQRFGLADIQTLTPREFALRAEDLFQSRFRTAGVTGTTLALVESFYAVRFGDTPLSTDQLRNVEQQLGQLERCLAQPVT